MQSSAYHNGNAQRFVGRFATRLKGEQQLVVLHICPHSTSVCFCFWHSLTNHDIAVARKDSGIGDAMLVVELQRSATSILCPGFLNESSAFSVESHCARQMLAISFVRFVSHTSPRSFHYHSAFWIEIQDWRIFLHIRAEIAHMRTLRHVVIIDAWHFWLVVEREDATVEFLVVAIELLRHFLIEEPTLSRPSVGMLIFAPIQLPTRIGSQLVEAAIEGIVQDKRACALTVFQLYEMTLQHIAFLIPEFSIEQLAQVREFTRVAPANISLEVKRIASKIAGVVQVQEHFFLRNVTAKEFQVLFPTFQRRGQARISLCALEDIAEVPLQAVTLPHHRTEDKQQTIYR